MTNKAMTIFLALVFYLEVCLVVITFMHIPQPQLQIHLYPIQLLVPEKHSPYEKDCWGIEDDYCWNEYYFI